MENIVAKRLSLKRDRNLIEVKGIEKTLETTGNWRFIQQKSVQLLLKEKNFFIYIVDNLIGGNVFCFSTY